MPLKQFIKDESPKVIGKEFKEFAQDVFGAKRIFEEAPLQYSMYVPGKLTRAEFEEGMTEFCERYGLSFELIDQAPEAPSRQYFSENLKLMYPDVKSYEVLEKNEKKFERAKQLFKVEYEREFNPEDEDDKEDIVLLYNEYMEDLRKWKPVEVKLILAEEEKEVKGKDSMKKTWIVETDGGKQILVEAETEDEARSIFEKDLSREETEDPHQFVKAHIKSVRLKDEEEDDEVLQVVRLLGEAHDKLIEAMDLIESLENDDKVSSDLRYAAEDVEAPLSELDFMGEADPVKAMFKSFPIPNQGDEEEEDEEVIEAGLDEEDWY